MDNKKQTIIMGSLPWVIALLVILLMTSCVYDEEFSRANSRISDLNMKVTNIQENYDDKLNSISSNQAEILVEIESIKQSIKDLANRVEDNEHVIRYSFEKDLSEQDSIKAKLSQLAEISAKIDNLEKFVKQHHEYLGLGQMEMPEGTLEDRIGVGNISREETEGTANRSRDIFLYEKALSLFNDKKYSRSLDGFKIFLEEFPKSDLADNAQFWIGECFMALNQYDQAILAYQEVIKKYPKENKVPNAMLRQAIAWLEIGEKTSSEILLKNIIKQYPDSNEAKLARKKLDSMK
jgi:tol-pal system protein YbgF